MSKIKIDMTKGRILPLLIRFALPAMATSVIHQLFNTADTIVVGRWGGATPEACEIALSAVSACGPLVSMIITFFLGLSVGSGIMVSHAVGAGEDRAVKKIVHTSVTLATLFGILLGILGFCFARPLLVLMETPHSIIDQAVPYMRAYFLGIPAQLIYSYCSSMLQATGDSTRPLIFLSTAGVVNVLLNLVMVLGFGQGALGVGIATAASQWVSCTMILVYMLKTSGLLKLQPRQLTLESATLKQVLRLGVPAGIQNSMFAIGNLVMQVALNSFNSSVYASGSSIASNVGAYTQLICGGFCTAAYVFVGQNTGAKNMPRIRECMKTSTLTISALAIVLNGLLNIVSLPLLTLYAPGNPEVVEFARIKLVVNSTFYIMGHLEGLYGSAIRALGKSTLPMIVSVAGICGVRVLWINTVFVWIRHPLTIFFAYGASWTITFIVQAILYRRLQKKIGAAWEAEKETTAAAELAEATT
jgi:putative MATE family efflux protein